MIEIKFPSQLRDSLDFLKFIEDNNQNDDALSCVDVSRCFVAGESEFKKVRMLGLISIQPFFDREEITESKIQLGRGALGVDWTDCCWRWW
ncbi:putative carboxylesterase [Rosa chinensis]|uniref:Putative carboxylesterase n=1 Tax=Rosa chinensis TaxID=74649 RepID=A0A2P6RTT6_ROSCH|nr:putative carboxylesterase [Rosa chinensis]